jgi:hypothetical protein
MGELIDLPFPMTGSGEILKTVESVEAAIAHGERLSMFPPSFRRLLSLTLLTGQSCSATVKSTADVASRGALPSRTLALIPPCASLFFFIAFPPLSLPLPFSAASFCLR